jgi:hypothetical protein
MVLASTQLTTTGATLTVVLALCVKEPRTQTETTVMMNGSAKACTSAYKYKTESL